MTPSMIDRARRNAKGMENVEFHLSTIDVLPLPDASVDCIISNCVINLAEDKAAVLREAFRVLKPGGRFAVSDIALKQELPAELAESVASYVGCIAGALSIDEFERLLVASGFSGVQIVDAGADLNAYAKVEGQNGCCSPAMEAGEAACCASSEDEGVHAGLAKLLERHDVNDYAASVKVFAVKPE